MENLIVYESPYPKQRIGRNCDGGYVVCDIPHTGNMPYDRIISGGVGDDISFEYHLLNIYNNVSIDLFDGTINPSLLKGVNSRINFICKNLGKHNDEHTTNLKDEMEPYNDIFMKMDIEGHEFRILPVMIENGSISKVKQLVIEFHSPADIQMFPDYFRGLSDVNNELMFDTLQKLNKTHKLVHFHGNNGCKMHMIEGIKLPHVFECTYIRTSPDMNLEKSKSPIPSVWDRPNVNHNPEIQLSGYPYNTL